MPVNNTRAYSGSQASKNKSQSYSKPVSRSSGFSKENYNMLNFGTGFCDIKEEDRNGIPTHMLLRLFLKTAKKSKVLVNVIDEQENEFTPEEAIQIVAAALLEGNAITVHLMLNEDGSYGGNARINIKGINFELATDVEPEPEPLVPFKKAVAKKRDYERDIRNNADEVEETDIPY